jgi:hypothetical protein
MQDLDQFSEDKESLITPLDAIRMDKTAFSVVSLDQADAEDKAYWRTQSPEARLEALELMRQVMYGYDPLSDRIERVLEVVKRPPR